MGEFDNIQVWGIWLGFALVLALIFLPWRIAPDGLAELRIGKIAISRPRNWVLLEVENMAPIAASQVGLKIAEAKPKGWRITDRQRETADFLRTCPLEVAQPGRAGAESGGPVEFININPLDTASFDILSQQADGSYLVHAVKFVRDESDKLARVKQILARGKYLLSMRANSENAHAVSEKFILKVRGDGNVAFRRAWLGLF